MAIFFEHICQQHPSSSNFVYAPASNHRENDPAENVEAIYYQTPHSL